MPERAQKNQTGRLPDLPPPPGTTGVMPWLRKNLFSSPLSIFLTLLSVWIIFKIVPPVIDWAFVNATWSGADERACLSENGVRLEGACWLAISIFFKLLMFGGYPTEETWRIGVTGMAGGTGLVWFFFPKAPCRKWVGVFMTLVYPSFCFTILFGGLGLAEIKTRELGGLSLTLFVFAAVFLTSIPLGIILALGRHSRMPVIRISCAAFIEFWRGFPPILVLFSAAIMAPLFLPEGVSVDKIVRVWGVLALYFSAYMAEAIRGGLQVIPRDFYDSGIGFGYLKAMGSVVLPPALGFAIPGIFNTAVGVLKMTSLLMIIWVMALTGAGSYILQETKWGFISHLTLYVFMALVYWAIGFGISLYGRRFEKIVQATDEYKAVEHRLKASPLVAESTYSGSSVA